MFIYIYIYMYIMDDITLVAESKLHMEQLVTRIQELFKRSVIKNISLQNAAVYQ